MANRAGARHVAPVHHQTFKLSDEPLDEPIERLNHALRLDSDRIAWQKIGATFVCPRG